MSIKESALTAITSIAQSDFIRAVTSAGASRRVTVANLAKAIIESYTGSSLAGSNQSIKAALDLLNSKTKTIGGGGSNNNTIVFTATSETDTREHIIFCYGICSGQRIVAFILYYRPSQQLAIVKSWGDVEAIASISGNEARVKVANYMNLNILSRYVEEVSFISS